MEFAALPTPKEFKEAISSLSPEQQRFSKMFRNMQLRHVTAIFLRGPLPRFLPSSLPFVFPFSFTFSSTFPFLFSDVF